MNNDFSSRIKNSTWSVYLHEDLKELLQESLILLDLPEEWRNKFHDYSFVVFPAAKAYEGFLKKLFLDLGFITEVDYQGDRFRIGKALNPSFKNSAGQYESIYLKLIDLCQGEALADNLWQTWKVSRNLIFHWFPNEKNAIDFSTAKERVEKILDAMDMAFNDCEAKMEAKGH